MSHRPIHVWAAAAALLLPGAATGVQGQPLPAPSPAPSAAFTLRADPRWASEINAVLARMAEPIRVPAASAGDAAATLAHRCGGRPPKQLEAAADGTELAFAPCLRSTLEAKARALPGDTLEDIAVRNGLLPGAAETMRVIPHALAAESSRPRAQVIAPKRLQVGDVVVMKELPRWTDFRVRAEVAAGRAELVDALAEAVHCGPTAPAEKCLLEKGLFLLDHAPGATPEQPAPPRPESLPGSARIDTITASPMAHAELRAGRIARIPTVNAIELAVGAAAPAAAPPEPAAPPGPAPVAAEQWPYDAGLVASLLLDQQAEHGRLPVIGVADDGLRSAAGAPLPPACFAHPLESLVDDGVDDDLNDYVDDALGAGITTEDDDARRQGDVSLCTSDPNPPFAAWSPDLRALASHGSVVASVAAGLRLRALSPEAGRLLPAVTFFRLVQSACDPGAALGFDDAEAIKAFDYLYRRADVISISSTSSSSGDGFNQAVRATLGNGGKMLVLPAGNDTPGDLDADSVCPACLALPENGDLQTANRTLVIGAATRALRRASYSNFGARTVLLYAPGEPAGTLDILGEDASAASPATSYAAPYAALAVGILKSLGISDVADVRDRLRASTWPLFDAAGNPEDGLGVIDLAKVAAVRRDAVEVIETRDDGAAVRRTYVGRLETDASGRVTVCSGFSFGEAGTYAIRLGEPGADGLSRGRAFLRSLDKNKHRRSVPFPCQPEGSVTLHTLGGDDRVFQMAHVRAIQFRWFRD